MPRLELLLKAKTKNIKEINIEKVVLCTITCTACKHKHENEVEINEETIFHNDKGERVNLLMKCRYCNIKMTCRILDSAKQNKENVILCVFEVNGCIIENIKVRTFFVTSTDKTTFEIDGMPKLWKDKDLNGSSVSLEGLKLELRKIKK